VNVQVIQGFQLLAGLFLGSMSIYSLLQQAITLAVTFMFCLYAVDLVFKWLLGNQQEVNQMQA